MKEINVLSLFDGMSCGQIALERARIKVNNYYASEIDKHAIKVTMANYPNTKQLGSVTEWRTWDIDWSSIGLLIGGSPCQGFSFAGKGLNFEDPRSKLFFVYVEILNHIRTFNPAVKFMLENVKMKKESLSIISEFLGVGPVLICSSKLTPQKRKRWYWTNISKIEQPKDLELTFSSILETGIEDESLYLTDEQIERGRKKHAAQTYKTGTKMGKVSFPTDTSKKAKTLTKVNVIASRETNHVLDNGRIRILTRTEREKLQGVPIGYTNPVSKTQASSMLGNGWTVDIIAHIFTALNSPQQPHP